MNSEDSDLKSKRIESMTSNSLSKAIKTANYLALLSILNKRNRRYYLMITDHELAREVRNGSC